MPFERDETDLVEIYYERGWTDGLPVVPPTEQKVAALVGASGLRADAALGEIAPNFGAATVERVAVNAVMAGCLPGHMPLVVAGVRALADEAFGLHAVSCMTDSAAPLAIVNGPARGAAGINSGIGVFGSGTRGNAVVGRALALIIANVGGSRPGGISKTMFGSPGRYTYCIGENEEESPWEPLHVERGLRPEEGAISLFACEAPREFRAEEVESPEALAELLGRSLCGVWSADAFPLKLSGVLIALGPLHASILGRAGWSKADARRAIFEGAQAPAPGGGPGRRKFRSPDDLILIVAGGAGGIYSMVMPGVGDHMGTRLVTHPVARPGA